MNRSTARWTTAFAAAALIGVPAAGWSQTPPAATSQPPTAQQPADAPAQHGAAGEHIRKAEAALSEIPTSTLPARAKPRVAELKRHLNSLEKSAAASYASSTSAAKPSSKPKETWSKDVADIDKILTELLGPSAASGTGAPPAATGTTGQSKSDTLTIDDTTKAKLMEVRQHVTAFATSMSGAGSSAPGAPSSEPSPEPAAAAAQAQAPSPTPTAESTPAASASAPSPQSAAAAQSPAASSQPPAEQTQAQAPTAAASSRTDEEGAKRHLTDARDALAQLTQLPAAAQLTGDTRTQVSQLIGNFNELITAKADWRASYDKVAANVTALIGADAAPPEAAAAAPTGTPGAVGTSGSTAAALDPAIKGKLVEFRTHLMAFEKAAGTAPSGPSDSSPSSASSPMTPSSSSAMTSAPPASSAPPSASPSSPSPEPTASSSPAEQGAAAEQSAGKMSQDNPISHIEAIEAIIGSGSKLTLEQAQVEQIRAHLVQLRKAVEKK